MLPKKFRLPAEYFRKQYQKGKKTRGRYGMFVVSDNEITNPRFGFVVSKKIGSAVTRNRMTRLLRVVVMEIVNEKNLSNLNKDFQYIAFEFCDKKSLLKEEISLQIERSIND
ncbi:MAG: ribonuclease P protein component [Candidatus Dojkabacteria bacterium]